VVVVAAVEQEEEAVKHINRTVISEILRLDKVISRVPLNTTVPVTTNTAEDEVEEEVDVMERLLSGEISKCPTNSKINVKEG